MARGNRRAEIFLTDEDRRYFLQTLGEACAMTGWQVHAWVLMSNHYHLVIETPLANLVEGMSWLQNAYTRRFNTRNQLWGRLFGDRYKAVLVESSEGDYLASLLDYLHLNPVRAGLIKPARGQSVADFPWSSVAGGYLLPAGKQPPWFNASLGMGTFGCADSTVGCQRFVRRLNERAVSEELQRCGVPETDPEVDARLSRLDRGWYWGSREFAETILQLGGQMIGQKKGRSHRYSGERKSHDEQEAARILREGSKAAGVKPREWAQMRGSDARKVALAHLIWSSTTVPQSWIADKLSMSSAANASQQIRRWKAQPKNADLPKSLQDFLSRYDT